MELIQCGNAFLSLLLSLIVIFGSCENSFAIHPANLTIFTRKSFPHNFIFGASSSAYQYEGSTNVDGRGESIWDVFVRQDPTPRNIEANADVAVDFYNRFQDDIKLMKHIGLDAFRLSISWTRIIPTGKLSDGVNPKGIFFYNNVINDLIAHGIQPFVTIYHWDLPQPLQKEYGGFLSHLVTKDFMDFAEVCFKEFGDRVKHWVTINEPWNVAYFGFDVGLQPPNRCSDWMNNKCSGGDSGTEPYIVTHNMLISHAEIVNLYRQKYKPHQKGEIGIVLDPTWFKPYSNKDDDIEAAQRAVDFNYGWFLDPLVFGEYPKSMEHIVGDRLPKFTYKQKKLVAGSLDFLGINYYTSEFAKNIPFHPVGANKSYSTDALVEQTFVRDGVSIGDPTGTPYFYVYPAGFYEVLKYTSDKYTRKMPIYITECGYAEIGNNTASKGLADYKGIEDMKRIHFFTDHLLAMKSAIKEGVNVKGFFAWSFMDNWEWGTYNSRFGLIFVDYTDNLKRHLKYSALFFKKFLRKTSHDARVMIMGDIQNNHPYTCQLLIKCLRSMS